MMSPSTVSDQRTSVIPTVIWNGSSVSHEEATKSVAKYGDVETMSTVPGLSWKDGAEGGGTLTASATSQEVEAVSLHDAGPMLPSSTLRPVLGPSLRSGLGTLRNPHGFRRNTDSTMDLHEAWCVEAKEDASPSNSDSSPKSVFASSPISSVAHSPVKERAVTPTSRKHFAQVKELLELCKPSSNLKHLVKECFDHVACDPGEPVLDLQAFMIFITELASSLGMAEDAFGDGTDEFLRFDFGGTGTVNIQECFKFARYHIKDYAKNLAPSLFDVQLPHKTLDEEGYRIVRKLGEGSFGEMLLAVNKLGEARAIKCCSKSKADVKVLDELKEEFNAMRKTEHPNIAETFDIFQDDELYYLVNKPYFGGELVVLTERASKSGVVMVEDWWRRIFKQCFEGLRYLHRHAMMHCDIKEPNIMMKTTDYWAPEMVIIDYGLVQAYTKDRVTTCGTPGYIPPETWRTKKWYPKGDVFSLGVCMVQLLVDKYGIFTENCANMSEVSEATQHRPVPLELLPRSWVRLPCLVGRLLARDQQDRFTVNRALEDPWFNDESSSQDVHDPFGNRSPSHEAVVSSTHSPGRVQATKLRNGPDLAKRRNGHKLRACSMTLPVWPGSCTTVLPTRFRSSSPSVRPPYNVALVLPRSSRFPQWGPRCHGALFSGSPFSCGRSGADLAESGTGHKLRACSMTAPVWPGSSTTVCPRRLRSSSASVRPPRKILNIPRRALTLPPAHTTVIVCV
uniref:Protein kinase domain-containing protein n=1 Tax=Noctiluca scintillans TaxID=2966 RepID=A0A7S1ALD0_NOCSC|mmetsp:Transcript_50739/g.135288  ORF Transcript_50739/g.135288 Transcript_50739/m.135288 type:complete len:735 (+) Transcript_50739:50-2254(+)